MNKAQKEAIEKMRSTKLITCILPKGKAMPLLKLLKQDYGLINANFDHARGSGRFGPLTERGIGEQTEKEILTVMVEQQQAEEIFNFIFFNANINQPHGGMIFQNALSLATQYRIPEELPFEK